MFVSSSLSQEREVDKDSQHSGFGKTCGGDRAMSTLGEKEEEKQKHKEVLK